MKLQMPAEEKHGVMAWREVLGLKFTQKMDRRSF
jgi:hypothetical protein